MIGKVNFSAVVKDHYKTLVNEGANKTSGLDFTLFYLLPVLAGVALVCYHLILGKGMTNVLITALAVFAGLLFNLLLLIFDIANKPRTDDARLTPLKIRFLKEIYSNIAYAILISLLTIVVLLAHYGFLALNWTLALHFSAFVVYAMCGNFILTLLMVLKRVHVLLNTEFKGL